MGCPCGTQGKCCDNTNAFHPEHDEPKDADAFCEECYHLECSNCGATCGCEL
jgi:hypothetical protein